ncbi:hypothetical protein V2A60_010241 [Cordyceps javanica]|uniref:Mitochondrial pyruvate carrier n=1 Tax=Cordyceps javanica TaxID=43265 RepID=A0A545UV52_9HYPO|nr:UPF0041 domain-containing protein [Cordyceps javanica]TQW05314.1 UPF0041 domain protein [Cordyceps javanica]
MASTSTILRAARPMFRPTAFASPARQAFARATQQQQQVMRFRFQNRRWQSSEAGAGSAGSQSQQQQQQQSWFKRMWESEIGIKTVHFWAPVMKWALVIAGISDFARPVEKLSFTQNFALTCTGLIWTRWCLIIKPKNYLLAAVNFFLGLVGIVQVSRILLARGVTAEVAEVVDEAKKDAKEVKDQVKEQVKA